VVTSGAAETNQRFAVVIGDQHRISPWHTVTPKIMLNQKWKIA
jgi:hypothetical protein